MINMDSLLHSMNSASCIDLLIIQENVAMKVQFFGHFKGIWGQFQFWMHHACKIGFYDPSNRDFMLHFVTFSHFSRVKPKQNAIWYGRRAQHY